MNNNIFKTRECSFSMLRICLKLDLIIPFVLVSAGARWEGFDYGFYSAIILVILGTVVETKLNKPQFTRLAKLVIFLTVTGSLTFIVCAILLCKLSTLGQPLYLLHYYGKAKILLGLFAYLILSRGLEIINTYLAGRKGGNPEH